MKITQLTTTYYMRSKSFSRHKLRATDEAAAIIEAAAMLDQYYTGSGPKEPFAVDCVTAETIYSR